MKTTFARVLRFGLIFFSIALLSRCWAASNQAPIARNDTYTVNEDTVLTKASAEGVLSNDSDPNADPLTAIRVSGPSNGTLTLNANGAFTYTPNLNFNGVDTFRYKCNDGRTDSSTATVTISVSAVNDPPVATGETFTINEDSVLSVPAPGVLANDTDVEGGPLTASKVGNTFPRNGTAVVNANGSFTYTPFRNFNGSDVILYVVRDSESRTDIGSVNITILPVNDRPVAGAVTMTVPANTTVEVPFRGTDVDDDPLSTRIETQPLHGTLAALAGGFTYTPADDYVGPDFFTYTVADRTLRSTAGTVSIQVLPELSVRDATVTESSGFLCLANLFTVAPVQIDLSAPSPVPIELLVLGEDGTANEDDYLVFNVITIPANTLSFTDDTPWVAEDCNCEPSETFRVIYSPRENSVNFVLIRRGTATITILNDDICFGTAELNPPNAAVHAGETLDYSLTWIHPEQWRLIETMDLRISDDEGTIFYLHWEEPGNTFSLVNPANGDLGHAAIAGEPGRLETCETSLNLLESSVVGSGPTGLSVTLNLKLSFKPQAAGRSYRVEAFATDDFGHGQGFELVGTLAVLPK